MDGLKGAEKDGMLGSAPYHLDTHAGAHAMRAFLVGQGADALAGRLLALALRDPEVSRELLQWRGGTPPPPPLAEARSLVDDILDPGRDHIGWGTAGPFVARAEAVVSLLAAVRARDPEQAIELGERGMRIAWEVLSRRADDSFGEIGRLTERIAGEWLAALAAAPPRPEAFGAHYLQILLDDPFGCFDAGAAEASMGTPAREAFRREVAARWSSARAALMSATDAEIASLEAGSRQALTVRRHAAQVRRVDAALRYRHGQLEAHHLRQLEAAGDVKALLEVLRDGLTEPGGYLRISAMLDRLGRPAQALAYARKGCEAFPGQVRLLEDLLERVERAHSKRSAVSESASAAPDSGGADRSAVRARTTGESVGIRRQLFELDPSVVRYRGLLEAKRAVAGGEGDGRDAVAALRAELMAWLQVRERERDVVQARSGLGPDVSLRVQILCAEEQWEEVFTALRPPARCSPAVRLGIARSLPAAMTGQAARLLMGVLEEQLLTAKSPYRSELALVRETARLFGSLERRRWIASLAVRYAAKPNFVRSLASEEQ